MGLISVNFTGNLNVVYIFPEVKIPLVFVPDEKSWKAEAEIDMELFHQVDCLVLLK